MNIFTIEKNEQGDVDWIASAKALDNYRVVKMILESCQMLSTVLRNQGVEDDLLYKATHAKHPCTLWAAKSSGNFLSLCEHTYAMLEEYTERFGKKHKSGAVLDRCVELFDEKNFSWLEITPPPMAMPDHFKGEDIVESYRRFYASKPRMRYPKEKIPSWFVEYRGNQEFIVV